MNIEDIQVIWNENAPEPLFVVNTDKLQQHVHKQAKESKKALFLTETIPPIIFIGLFITVISEPIMQGHDYHQLFTAPIYLIVAIFFLQKRWHRLKSIITYDDTISGRLAATIANLDAHRKIYHYALWWYTLPIGGGVLISSFFTNKPWWLWVAMVCALTFCSWMFKYSGGKISKSISKLKTLQAQLTR